MKRRPAPLFEPGDRVTHILSPSRRGLVTAFAYGFNGYSYRVTWADDFEDETHFAPELVLDKKGSETIGFMK